MVVLYVAKEGSDEVKDAVKIEIKEDETIIELSSEIAKALYKSEDISGSDLSVFQDGKPFGARAKISKLDEDSTVWVKRKEKAAKKDNVEEKSKENEKIRDEIIQAHEGKLKMIDDYRQSISNKASHLDMSQQIKEMKDELTLDQTIRTKGEALRALDKLVKDIKGMNYTVKSLDLKAVDMPKRCLELLEGKMPKGFVFEIEKVIITPASDELIFNYTGEEEVTECSKTKLSYKNKSAIAQNVGVVGFAYGGIGMASQEYTGKSAKNTESRNQERSMQKTTVAIASFMGVKQFAKFKCKVSLDEDAIELAKLIVEEKEEIKREKAALDFLDEYPAEILTGFFGIGGSYENKAITRSNEKIEYSELVKEATAKAKSEVSVAAKAFFGAGAAQVGIAENTENEHGEGTADQKTNNNKEITTQCQFRCEGPTVRNIKDLELGLEDSQKWTVFPEIGRTKNHQYKRIDAIMRKYGKHKNCQEMIDAAKVVQNIIENGPSLVIRSVQMPDNAVMKNVIVFGKTGSGKSALGNVLVGDYDLVTSNNQESCTKNTTSISSAERKITYFDTMGSFDTNEYDSKEEESNCGILNGIVNTWRELGPKGLHCLLLTLNAGSRLGVDEANFVKASCESLFGKDASNRVILVITKCSPALISSEKKRNEYLDEQTKSKTNHFNVFDKIIGGDRKRIVFVDSKMPADAPEGEDEVVKCKQHNVNMAEDLLRAIHDLPDDGIENPIQESLTKEENIKRELEKERAKTIPDVKRIERLEKDLEEITGEIEMTALGAVAALFKAAFIPWPYKNKTDEAKKAVKKLFNWSIESFRW